MFRHIISLLVEESAHRLKVYIKSNKKYFHPRAIWTLELDTRHMAGWFDLYTHLLTVALDSLR